MRDEKLSTFVSLIGEGEKQAMHIKRFLDRIPGGFFIYRADESRELLYVNEAMQQIFGCDTLKEFWLLTGNSFRGIVHPEDLENVERRIREQIENSQYDLDYAEYRIIRKDGEVRWVDAYSHFVKNDFAGDIFYVFVADSTEKREQLLQEKRQKEQLLQERTKEYTQQLQLIHQEHLRRLEMIEGLSIDYESIFYVDLHKNRIRAYRVSPRFAKQFADERTQDFEGFDAAYIEKWVHPEDREALEGVSRIAYIREKLKANTAFHMNYRIMRNGKPSYIQLRVVNAGKEVNVSQVVWAYRNIDDEIIQELKQKQMMKEALDSANSANNAKNLFLSNMSHDIRTPMNAIVGFTSLVKKHIDDKERIQEYLDIISASSDQLLQLLNDVLEISRIESGKIYVEESECSLMDIAQQVQMAILPKAAAKNITLSLDISNLKHDVVSTDQMKLKQILQHLVDNAVKYTKDGGWVTITLIEQLEAAKEHRPFQFIVEDNGIGISAEFLKHIFTPFEREKNTTSSGIHGTGLGLTIAKDLAGILGGTIEVSSMVGKGSKFTVTVPVYVHERKTLEIETTEDTPFAFTTPKRILVVDDNEINLEIENEVLKDFGFLVDTAGDGAIAVRKIEQSEPGDYDLILMDIQMPIMDGYHAARAIRAIENPVLAGIPIIAVSANAFDEDKRKAIESGMDGHLEKPLDTQKLYRVLRKFLRNAENTGELNEIVIRPMREEEQIFMEDFLRGAIYQPGNPMNGQELLKRPELAAYIQDFGKEGDYCLVAESEGHVLGMVWTRILAGEIKGYGYIDNRTPEFVISVKKECQRHGIGRKLMQEMIAILKNEGYPRASLSVNRENYAYWLYRKLGFQVVKVMEEAYLMVLEL
ncbi:MAG: GNAT family N-acetyltransferase [Blautia sp.]|nr:GNAT family N-acetyltransferase [Lachnoclostridium sp.]MCM1212329.1 GNAT family N-acetyltransferase [Blautia sp.]